MPNNKEWDEYVLGVAKAIDDLYEEYDVTPEEVDEHEINECENCCRECCDLEDIIQCCHETKLEEEYEDLYLKPKLQNSEHGHYSCF